MKSLGGVSDGKRTRNSGGWLSMMPTESARSSSSTSSSSGLNKGPTFRPAARSLLGTSEMVPSSIKSSGDGVVVTDDEESVMTRRLPGTSMATSSSKKALFDVTGEPTARSQLLEQKGGAVKKARPAIERLSSSATPKGPAMVRMGMGAAILEGSGEKRMGSSTGTMLRVSNKPLPMRSSSSSCGSGGGFEQGRATALEEEESDGEEEDEENTEEEEEEEVGDDDPFGPFRPDRPIGKFHELELPAEPLPVSVDDESDKLAQLMEDFVKMRQFYQKEVDGAREFMAEASENLMDITCDIYVLNAEVLTMEDPALNDRVKELVRSCREWQAVDHN